MIQAFEISGRLDGLNEYTKANRGNRYGGNQMKKRNEKKVLEGVERVEIRSVVNYPCELKITWYEPNRRRDIDNITFATKFIQDALVKAGVLDNDDQKHISGLTHTVTVDKDNPRIVVEIIEKE